MLKALVPVDGSGNALCAIWHVIRLVQEGNPIKLHVLNVQPPFHGDVTAFVSKSSMNDHHREQGEAALAAACALLDGAGVPYRKHIMVGHPARVIAQCARDLDCGEVIMGTHGYGTIGQLVHGSVSHEAIHQMDPHIPVTLVKEGYADAAPKG